MLLNDNLRLLNIFNSFNPNDFIIKCDLRNSLFKVELIVLTRDKYYNETINTLLHKKASQKVMLDCN